MSSMFSSSDDFSNGDPVQEAYRDALKIFCDQLTDDEKKQHWAGEYADIKEIEDVVRSAKNQYESRQSDSKVKVWLGKLSARILLYASVLDVLAAHHPEYVSLVWGSVKFLLRAVLNHEELVIRIAKALTEIGDALPRIHVQAGLYASEAMKHAVAMVYANVIKFFNRAITWYSASKLKRAVSVIWHPYELRFGDIVEEISRHSRNVDQLAFVASQIEIRQMRHEQQELLRVMRDTRQIVIDHQAINFRGFLDSNRRLCEMQFSQILTAVALSSLPAPERAFRQSKFLGARRGLLRPDNYDRLWWQSSKLRDWASSTSSALLLAQSSFLNRLELKDLSVELVDLLRGLRVPVVWALSPRAKTNGPISNVDVLKQLVFQTLQRNPALLKNQSTELNPARFQCAVTQDQWFDLLALVLVGIPQIYVVIDGGLIGSQLDTEIAWPTALNGVIQMLRSKCPETVVKVLLTVHQMSSVAGGSLPDSLQDITWRSQTSRRRSGSGQNRQAIRGGNSRLLRPFIMQSSSAEGGHSLTDFGVHAFSGT